MRALVFAMVVAGCTSDDSLVHGTLVNGAYDVTFELQTTPAHDTPALVAATAVTVADGSVAFACDGCAPMTFVTRDDQCAHIDASAGLGGFSLCGLADGRIAADLIFDSGDRWCMFGDR
jgi:hypothetical protein